jgi:hypothetical protein
MPTFPTREADISELADRMVRGYIAHHGDFPSTFVVVLLAALKAYKTARDNQIQSQSSFRLATERKAASLTQLADIMQRDLKKSEVDVCSAPEKLAYIGWGPKEPPRPVAAPGPPRSLTAAGEGPGTLELRWQGPEPGAGGPVRTYVVERRQQPAGGGDFSAWQDIATSIAAEINLTDQPRGIQLEYRVRAINTGGESAASNTVAVVL